MSRPNSLIDSRSNITSAINIINCYNSIYDPNPRFQKFIRLSNNWRLNINYKCSKVNHHLLCAELDAIRIPLIKSFCHMVGDTQGYILFNKAISMDDLYSLFPRNRGKLETLLYMNFEFLIKSHRLNQIQLYDEFQQDEDLLDMLLYLAIQPKDSKLISFREIQVNFSNMLHKVNSEGNILQSVIQIYNSHKKEEEHQIAEHIRGYIRRLCIQDNSKSKRIS